MGLLAELTHRCPLGCPYCSNPVALEGRSEELDTETWKRVFSDAAAMGVLHVHLSGGEPCARKDIVALTKHCAEVGLYTNLITSGVGVSEALIGELAAAGLDHVQLSIQDAEPASADRIAGYKGAYGRKRDVARWVRETGMPLTVNAVMHRANIERAGAMVELAVELGARRVEVAHTQYYGWAIPNRAALMPTKEQTDRALAVVEELRHKLEGTIVIDQVIPDYYGTYPKACMGGWGRRSLNVTPSGKVLPCHAAETIPGFEFWTVKDHGLAEIWAGSPAFNAFRGTDWMQEPCKSCSRKRVDFGGCRCQALALVGDARATDPVCHLSPHHERIRELAHATSVDTAEPAYRYRRIGG
jgi:pyrroloquinoline quinone biosynthesis protein E